jgi:hypothetical protein
MIYIFTQVKFSTASDAILRIATEGFHTDPSFFDTTMMKMTKESADASFDHGYFDYAVVEKVESGFLKKAKQVQWYKLGDNGMEKVSPPSGCDKLPYAIYQHE